jgi:hypothetical protein
MYPAGFQYDLRKAEFISLVILTKKTHTTAEGDEKEKRKKRKETYLQETKHIRRLYCIITHDGGHPDGIG